MWIAGALGLLVAATPLTVNAFGYAYRAGFQLCCFALGLLALCSSAGAQRLLGGRAACVLPLVGLWLIGVVRLPLALDRPAALAQALDRAALLMPLLLLAGGACDRAGRRRVLGAGLLGAGLVAVWGILQVFGVHPFMPREVWEPSRPTRPLGTHNLMGGYQLAWLPLALGWFWVARGRWRVALAVIVVAGWSCLLLTQSRGAWLAGCGALALMAPWLLLRGRARLVAGWRRAPRATWALAGVLLLVTAVSMPGVLERLRTPARAVTVAPRGGAQGSPVELTSFERRALIARGAWRLIGERPLLGWGPASFRLAFYGAKPPLMRRLEAVNGQTAFHAHADGLELAAEAGAVGLLLAVAGILATLWWGGRALLRRAGGATGEAGETGSAGGAGSAGEGFLSHDGLLEAGLVMGTLGLLLHGLVDFDFHELPTALVGAVFLGLLAQAARVPERAGPAALAAVGRGWVRGTVAAVLLLGVAGASLVAAAENAHRQAYATLERGDLDGAARLLERAQRLVPDQATYAVARAEVELHRDELAPSAAARVAALEAAALEFEHAAGLEPAVARHAVRAAQTWRQAIAAGSAARADTVASWAVRGAACNPYVVEAQLLLARVRREAGDLAGAAAALEAARSHVAGVEPPAAVAIEAGRLAAAEGREAAAINAWTATARERGSLAAVDALAELGGGAGRTALSELEAEGGPVGVRAGLHLADLALAAGDLAGAAQRLQALERRGGSADLTLRLAELAYRRGRLDEAAERFRAAVTAEPLRPEGLQGFGDVALARGDTARALRFYERALVRQPRNPELRRFVARLR